jgi:protein-tyrosine phosphatase
MAAGILKKLMQEEGGDILIDSAGICGCEGEPAASWAVRVCQEDGVDISDHIAKKINYELIKKSDLIVVMEMDHFEEIIRISPEKIDKVFFLGSLEDNKRLDSIPDPFGRGEKEYRECYDQIKRLVERVYQIMIKPGISS